MDKVIIYTDGACSGNPGDGGWAAILICKGQEKTISGSEKNTTNNRMELRAPIEALALLKRECEIEIYSDSAYLINAFNNGWIYNWYKNGWKTADKKDVKNKELWEQIYSFSKKHKINWIKVKGHSDNEYNNRCDQIAVNEIKKIRNTSSQE